jgi:hypothetical protein
VTRRRVLAVATALVALLVAVGAINALTREPKRVFVLPRCARPAQPIKPPPPFPSEFPLPKGTLFATLARYPAQIVLGGRVPRNLVSVVRYLLREMPRKGFRLGQGESEPGIEAESGFVGNGVVGRFTVRVLPRCHGAVFLAVSVARADAVVPNPPATRVRGSLPMCAGAREGVASGLPASFPLPAGTVIRSNRKQTIGKRSFVFVSAVTPETIIGAARFILRRLPKAGYRIASADQEANEAEAAFAGHGVHGRMRFHTLLGCGGALTLDIVTTRV